MPFEQYQRMGDFFEQRKEYRAATLKALRKREGLPSPVDEQGNELETRFDDLGNAHYYDASGNKVDKVMFAGAGKDGKPGGFAIGKRQQPSETVIDENGVPRVVPTADVSASWNSSDAGFEILEVSEDGRKLADELADLNRDSATYERAEKVSYGSVGEQAPGLELSSTSDEEVDRKLQEYVRRHE